MDPLTISIVVVLVIVATVALITPQGREGLKRLLNIGGARLSQASTQMETAEDQRTQLEARVKAETSMTLSQLESAMTGAKSVRTRYDELHAELRKWKAARDKAAVHVRRLLADDIPDENQQQQIGKAGGYGQTAMAKIAGLNAAIEALRPQVEQAEKDIEDIKGLMRSMPAQAEQMLLDGNIAAASQELATAQMQVAATQQAFSSESKGARLLEDMERKASRMRSRAESARARTLAAPRSADIVLTQLDALGSETSFDDFVAGEAEPVKQLPQDQSA